jgi:hypothetical protein
VKYEIVFEPVIEKGFLKGFGYAHVPALGLTTHGLGIEGARDAARDLVGLWIAEKEATQN